MAEHGLLEELLIPDVRLALLEKDWESFKESAGILHPPIVAEVLWDFDELDTLVQAFAVLAPVTRTQIFEYLTDEEQDALAARLPRADLAKMLELMSHDDRVDLVKRMSDSDQMEVMPLVAKADREDILRLARHDENTAGSIMTTDYAALPLEINVEQALARLRREAPNRETIYYIYVVDNDRKLIGFVSLKDLILAAPHKEVGQIMRKDVLYVTVGDDVEEAATKLADYDLLALPVVDEDNRLMGIITIDDATDVFQEEATEDIYRMGAMEPLESEYIENPFWDTVRKRVVWLLLLFCAEMCTSFVLDNYQGLFETFVFLVIFMPVITATGGNSGSQAASMITRSLALGEVEMSDWWRVGVRELFSGLTLGIAVGLFGSIVVFIFYRERMAMALVLIFALITVTTSGSLLGALMPFFFKRIGWDPAISSGPFVASMVDVVGIFIYCTIAAIVLPHFYAAAAGG